MRQHLKNIVKNIKSLRGKYSTWTIFDDFVTMGSISLRNAVDPIGRDKREKEYLDTAKKYTKKELDIFAETLGELVLGLDEDPSDILGEVYMELEISNKDAGQFFTPMSISNLMSELTVSGVEDHIKERGYVTLDEPSSGGGAMVIAFANAMRKKGHNYQEQLVVNARDLDIKAVQMCYIQLSLLGIPANVQHGNTITLEIFDEWKTPFFILGNWERKLRRSKGKPTKTIEFKSEEDGQLVMGG